MLTGNLKITRLEFIAENCPALATEAAALAIQELKKTSLDTVKYEQICTKYGITMDAEWMQTTLVKKNDFKLILLIFKLQIVQNFAKDKSEKLEDELKTYRNNSIKESIRLGFNELGKHYETMGDSINASKCFSRCKDYCTTGKHITDMCLDLIRVGLIIEIIINY